MKNFFFLTAALIASSTTFAQNVESASGRVEKADFAAKNVRVASVGEKIDGRFGGISAPQKSVANNLYYNRPEGAFYYGWDIDGGGWYYSALVVAPWKEFTFKNMSTDPKSVKWTLNFPVINSAGTAYEGYEERDVTDQAEANGDYVMALAPGYYSVAPTIKRGASTFTLCEGNENWQGKPGRETKVYLQDTLYSMCAVDHNQGFYYGTGSLSTDYFWGTGTLNHQTEGVGTCFGIRQKYDKPMSPLYVEKMFINALSASTTPIPAGKNLSLFIINDETGEPVEMLTATVSDVKDLTYNTNIKKNMFDLHFSKKVNTPLGVMVAPIVIDYPFTIQIEGFDEEGVDVGLYGNNVADGDNVENGEFLVKYGSANYRHYYTGLALPLCFQALFDGVRVWESATAGDETIERVNVLKVSADGTVCENNAVAGFAGAIVETATPWFDVDGAEMYFKTEDAPEWVNFSTTYNSSLEAYIVSAVCDPLPVGEKGRSAIVYIEGRGVTSDTPIIVVQGDAEIPSGISSAVTDKKDDANAPVYNLNGQRVTKNAKGMLIQNGKKFLNK